MSRKLSRSFKGAQVGGMLNFGDKDIYRVVGTFSAGGSAAESEIWADLKDVEKNTGRDGSVSSVQIRAASSEDFASLAENDRRRHPVQAGGDPRIGSISRASRVRVRFLKVVGTLIAVLLTFGAMFAAANTMFSAVKSAHARNRHHAGPWVLAV